MRKTTIIFVFFRCLFQCLENVTFENRWTDSFGIVGAIIRNGWKGKKKKFTNPKKADLRGKNISFCFEHTNLWSHNRFFLPSMCFFFSSFYSSYFWWFSYEHECEYACVYALCVYVVGAKPTNQLILLFLFVRVHGVLHWNEFVSWLFTWLFFPTWKPITEQKGGPSPWTIYFMANECKMQDECLMKTPKIHDRHIYRHIA